MLHRRRPWPAISLVVVSLAYAAAPAVAADAPGAPGDVATWTEGDKDGIGSATSLESRPLLTLDDGEMTEVYAPDLGTPSIRDLQFAVSDGRTFAEREREDATHRIELADPRSLTYRQVNTARSGRWRITKTYVTDPGRDAVLVDVTFESLTGRPLELYAILDPGLSNSGDDDRALTQDGTAAALDEHYASALAADPAPSQISSGYHGTSDGWTDLRTDFRMDWAYDAASAPGNVVQTLRLPLTGIGPKRRATLSLGFGAGPAAAAGTARAALAGGFAAASERYAAGWHAYLGGLARPASVQGRERLYDVSLMVMAALEDKTYRGAGIASPSMAWVWGTIPGYSGPYHLVWSRDLYQVASAQIAAGDRAAGGRALDYLWERQMQPDGCFPQNSNLDGSPHWPNLQLDEVADPILLAWQLGRSDATTWGYVRLAAGCILERGPTSQERWENAEGYSPATIAARSPRSSSPPTSPSATARPRTPRATATAPTPGRGPSPAGRGPATARCRRDPYYLRLTVDGNADAGTTYTIGDGGPTIDQRRVVDTSFLELVRLGVKAANDRDIVSTLPVVDAQLGVRTPSGTVLAPLQLRRLRRDARRRPVPGPRQPRPPVADLRRRARRVRARRRPARRGPRPPGRPGRHRERGPDAARAGLGRPGPARQHPRHGHPVGDPARLDARPVRPARLVDRRRAPRGAPGCRRLPLCLALPLTLLVAGGGAAAADELLEARERVPQRLRVGDLLAGQGGELADERVQRPARVRVAGALIVHEQALDLDDQRVADPARERAERGDQLAGELASRRHGSGPGPGPAAARRTRRRGRCRRGRTGGVGRVRAVVAVVADAVGVAVGGLGRVVREAVGVVADAVAVAVGPLRRVGRERVVAVQAPVAVGVGPARREVGGHGLAASPQQITPSLPRRMPQVCRAADDRAQRDRRRLLRRADLGAPAGRRAVAERTAQENCAPAETAENSPAGGSSIHAAPQQASEPSARTPQLCEAPAATAPNSPAGGVLMP